MKIYLVNLDRSPDRLQYMRRQLDDLNLPFERIAAVDGRSLDLSKMDEFAVRSRVEEWQDLLTPNMIACSLSHYTIYKKMVDEDIEIALILEDDIELEDNFAEVLSNVQQNGLNNTDVFLLYFHGNNKIFCNNRSINIQPGYSFYPAKTVWGPYSTGGYVIRKEVAKKLADHVFPVHTTPDSWGTFHRDKVIGGLWALLPLISRSANFGSDIGYHKFNKLIRFIEKIPFLPSRILFTTARRVLHKGTSTYKLVSEVPEWDESVPI